LVALAVSGGSLPTPAGGAAPSVSGPTDPTSHRLLVLPFFGVQSYRDGYNATAYGAGLRLGTFLGWRLSRAFSLNGQVAFERFGRSSGPPGAYLEEALWEATFSPLLHLPGKTVELVFGPMLGFWHRNDETRTVLDSLYETEIDRGYLYGLNVGLFVRTYVGISLGAMFSVQYRQDTSYCWTFPGEPERCESYPTEFTMMSACAAALY
jgi:hypothetical protein